MGRKRTYTPLKVYMNGRRVGTFTRQSTGAVAFVYSDEWLAWEHAMPISRSLPLRAQRFLGPPVLAVFENLLPDNDAIIKSVAEKTGAAGTDAHSLLATIGRDCIGALQFVPDDDDHGDDHVVAAGEIEGEALTDDDIAALIRGLASAPLGLAPDDAFRISLAGAQEKTALLFHEGQWLKPRGATPTTHIFKPPIGKLSDGQDLSLSVENEYLCLKLLEAFGLPVCRAEMGVFAGESALVVERFDRRFTKDGRLLRLPQEDCCQALGVPPSIKYEQQGGPGMIAILELLKESDQPQEDRKTFMMAQILFWMMAATDGHAKNYSLFIRPGGRYRLTPLYDVISLLPIYASHQIRRNEMKMAMAVGDSRHYRIDKIAPRHFEQTAKKAGLDTRVVEDAFATLNAELPDVLERVDQDLPDGFSAEIRDPIFQGLEKYGS